MDLLAFRHVFAAGILLAATAVVMPVAAEDMAFYEGKVSSSEVVEEDLAEVEPAAGPTCPEVVRNPCASGHGAVYTTDENGCRRVLRCSGLMLRPMLGVSK